MAADGAGAMMAVLKSLDSALGFVLRLVSVLCLVALMVVLAGNIVGRYTGTLPMPWFDEIVAALFAWMVFIGAAALWREREHFAIDLVPVMADGTVAGRPLRMLISLLGLIFALVLTWYGSIYALKTTATTPILSFPQAWVYACVPVAGAVMVIYALRDFILSTQTSNPNQEIDHNAV
jgi:TRAP-type C4-dicarboxylate transport system permease small subunit